MTGVHDYVTAYDILADVLRTMEDEAYILRNKGFYMSQIQQGLEELGFDAQFHETHIDLLVPNTGKLSFPYPSGVFSIVEIFGYKGDCCKMECAQPLWWKKGFFNTDQRGGYTSREHGQTNTPFSSRTGTYCDLYYFNVAEGFIHVSESCRHFDGIRIYFFGVPTDIGEVPFVPRMARQAIKDWVTMSVAESLIGYNMQKYGAIRNMAMQSLDLEGFNGTWHRTKKRMKKLDIKQYKDMGEYLSAPND